MSDLNLTIALRGGPASIQKRRRGKCGRNEPVVRVPLAAIVLQAHMTYPNDERARRKYVAAATREPVVTDKQHGGGSAARCTTRITRTTRAGRATTARRTKRHKSSTRSTASSSAGSDLSGDSSGHPPRSLRVEYGHLTATAVAEDKIAGRVPS